VGVRMLRAAARTLRRAALAAALLLALSALQRPARPIRRDRAAAALAAAEDTREPAQPSPADSLGALFIVQSHERAADFALEHFRSVYPRARVLMLNNGGEDAPMRAVARRHGVVQSYLQLPRVGRTIEEGAFEKLEDAMEWVRRVLNATVLWFPPEVTHVLMLEDDVNVVRRVNLGALLHDINGANEQGPTLTKAAEDVIRARTPPGWAPSRLVFGGFGGSILRRSFFAKMWATPTEQARVAADVEAFSKLDYGPTFSSYQLLSFLVYLRGGTVRSWPGLIETWIPGHEERLKRQDFEVWHRYTNLYE
jgi:hypothetical protein